MLNVDAALVGALGAAATWWLARAARRSAVTDRLATSGAPAFTNAHLEAWLEAAEIPTTPLGFLQVWAAAVVVSAIVGATFAPELAPVAALAGALAVPFLVAQRVRQAPRRSTVRLPDLVDDVATELRAGGTVATAVSRIATRHDANVRRLARRIELGGDPRTELRRFGAEHPAPDAALVAGALALVVELGGPSAQALDRLAQSLRDRVATAAEARALATQARVSALVIGLAPIGYLGVAAVLGFGVIDTLLRSPVGWACLVVGLALEAVGAWWMGRILRVGAQW